MMIATVIGWLDDSLPHQTEDRGRRPYRKNGPSPLRVPLGGRTARRSRPAARRAGGSPRLSGPRRGLLPRRPWRRRLRGAPRPLRTCETKLRETKDRFRWILQRWTAGVVPLKAIATPGPIGTISTRPEYNSSRRCGFKNRPRTSTTDSRFNLILPATARSSPRGARPPPLASVRRSHFGAQRTTNASSSARTSSKDGASKGGASERLTGRARRAGAPPASSAAHRTRRPRPSSRSSAPSGSA